MQSKSNNSFVILTCQKYPKGNADLENLARLLGTQDAKAMQDWKKLDIENLPKKYYFTTTGYMGLSL